MAFAEKPVNPPGSRFVYSDINFITLGALVERVSKVELDKYCAQNIFTPLKMARTRFLPPATWVPKIAPTEYDEQNRMLRGIVHDPTARRMGGVAGQAGLFSNADDLSKFARALIAGSLVLPSLLVEKMSTPQQPPAAHELRGFGWDIDSPFSTNRGELLPLGSFGHTGFTGTSLWIDPATRTYIVFLSNRVHPDGAGDVTPLRARVATIVASAMTDVAPAAARALEWPRAATLAPAGVVVRPPPAPLQTGIDVLRAGGFAQLKGLRVGLLTNHTGRTRDGVATIDALADAPDVKLAALFSPEHGIRGILDAAVPSSQDEKTGLPIHSLYGGTQRPTAQMLAGLDAIVIDLQDIGARFYTYISTMGYVLEEAAARKIKVFVLDRPNPIGGVLIEGPALDPTGVGFTGYFAQMPIR